MVGYPGETKANQRKTLEFSVKLRNMGAETYPQVISVLPLYGSELKRQAEEMGALHPIGDKPLDLSFLDTDSLIETNEFNRKDLEQLNRAWKHEYRKHSLTDPKIVRSRAKRLAELIRTKPRHALKRLVEETKATAKLLMGGNDSKY